MKKKKPLPAVDKRTAGSLANTNGNLEESELPFEDVSITRLRNSLYFSLDYVFIILEPSGYRLMVIHLGSKYFDKKYKSLRGAKIAFLRNYNHLAFKKNIKAGWTLHYHPDKEWLKDKLNKKPASEPLAPESIKK